MPRHSAPVRIDLEEAQRLLDEGESVRTIAAVFDVSPQSVYEHINAGRLKRPQKERE